MPINETDQTGAKKNCSDEQPLLQTSASCCGGTSGAIELPLFVLRPTRLPLEVLSQHCWSAAATAATDGGCYCWPLGSDV